MARRTSMMLRGKNRERERGRGSIVRKYTLGALATTGKSRKAGSAIRSSEPAQRSLRER